jgi:voltage-gated potassium channel
MSAGLQAAVYAILNPTELRPLPARLVKAVLVLTIAGSLVAAIWTTIPGLSPATMRVMGHISILCFAIFALEYLARLFSASGRDPDTEAHPLKVTLDYALSPLGLIDGLVVLPQLAHGLGLIEPGGARLAAVLAVVKIARYAPALTLVTTVMRNEGRSLMAALTVMLVLLVLTSTVMYLLEHDVQPQLFSSIPASMWWSIVTIASVGYGDMTPITLGGRIFAGCTMLLGIAMFAVPAGILATGFAAETRRDNFLKTWESVSKVPFFAALGPAAIADVTHMLRTMDLPARTMIIRKGQAGDCMYFIANGEVEVDLPGKKVTLGEGAFFGEMALLGNNLRSANITTTRVSKLLVLDLVDFRLLMARHPDLAETIDAEARRRALENK